MEHFGHASTSNRLMRGWAAIALACGIADAEGDGDCLRLMDLQLRQSHVQDPICQQKIAGGVFGIWYPGARKAICPWSSIRSFSINLQSSWDSLPSSERDAWQVLELDETAWKRLQSGSTPLRRFEHLTSAQQAAVLYGLRADASEWNALVERSPEAEERQVAAVPARSSGLVDSIIGGAWHLTKRYGPALGALLASDVARTPSRRSNAPLAAHVVGQLLQQLPWALDLREGPVTVDGLETVLYLDDSASMSGANLSEAQASLRKMAHLLQDSPTRVCTFADVKQVIVPREPRAAPSKQTAVLAGGESPRYFSNKFDHLDPAILCLQWTGRAPGTYMWHMILKDLRDKYIPGKGKLRVIVITDGLDVSSPQPYQGIQGMDPMMKELLKDGYDIEWHIVVVDISTGILGSMIEKAATSRYEALAESTGGGFLHIDQPGVMDDFSSRHFLSSLEKAVTGGKTNFLNSDEFKQQRGVYCARLQEVERPRPFLAACAPPPTEVEATYHDFQEISLAALILAAYQHQLPVLKSLVSSLYHARHHFLIHVDLKSATLLEGLKAWAAPFRNVHVRSQVSVKRSGASLLAAEIYGMLELLNLSAWHYFLVLSDSDQMAGGPELGELHRPRSDSTPSNVNQAVIAATV
ncbi:unnamed protein product [Effrenium voratum]|uniref:protein xylosyltransferase n=1 Tax=Effrenium voratum TaxID=2562239 RepID=A0AA36IUB1_9DINO|nr:unnamed protein product [Effrenium voratum]